MRTGVALGSNLGDRLANLCAARQQICDLTDIQPPVLSSAIYETDPVDCEPGAPKFLNAVIEFGYNGDPLQLLKELSRIESALGRPRQHARNVYRKIDIDHLYIGDTEVNERELELPHPRMHLRRFVLQPLSEIRPKLILPGHTKTVQELLAQLNDSCNVVPLRNGWESQ
jgi:2-amino-4-hydroxy-6-hydroxymethyldihydropteridine diphosphokinase